jgi:hypothetical protein
MSVRLFAVLLLATSMSAVVIAQETPAADTAVSGIRTAGKEQVILRVQGVVPGTPAEAVGVQEGDIFETYSGVAVHSLGELNAQKELTAKDDSVEIAVIRGAEHLTFRIPAGQIGVYLKEVLPDLEYREDAVVIDGIERLGWDTGKPNSFIAAVEAVARHVGADVDYTELNGISGAAFRLHFHKQWCPSSPDPGCGYPARNHVLDAAGFEYEFRHADTGDTEAQEALRNEAVASIDRGMPVIAIDLIGVPEWGVITGYQDGGKELLCRTYFDRRSGYEIAQKFPWSICLLDVPESAQVRFQPEDGFGVVVENLTTEEYNRYKSGLAAFDYWIEQLQTADFDAMDETRYRDEVSHSHAWIYDRLVSDRENGCEYLKRLAEKMPNKAGKLESLARLYREEAELLKPTEDVIVYAFNMKDRSDWSSEKRAEAVKRLGAAKVKEEAALALWRELAEAED